jgi:acylphosphatase
MSGSTHEPQSNHERRELIFSGHVQGVGFRYTTQEIARRFNVRGYVRNLSDGRVELIVEGERNELARFIAAIHQRMGSFIHDVKSNVMPATNQYTTFSIRH